MPGTPPPPPAPSPPPLQAPDPAALSDTSVTVACPSPPPDPGLGSKRAHRARHGSLQRSVSARDRSAYTRDVERQVDLERVRSGESTHSTRVRPQESFSQAPATRVNTHVLEEEDSTPHGERFCDSPSDESPSNTKDIPSDPEAHPAPEKGEKAEEKEGQEEEDPDLVGWDSPDSRENPRNWPYGRKLLCAITVASYSFLSPFSSSVVAPALEQISEDLNIGNLAEKNMVMSIFVLAYAFGPFFWSPLSEIVGRRPILVSGNAMFLAFNLGSSFTHKGPGVSGKVQMMVLRFLAGFGGSAPLVLGGATVADLFAPAERGTAMSIYTAAPVIAPALGPLIGGWVADKLDGSYKWRVTLWATSGFAALVAIVGFFILPETYQPQILHKKCEMLKRQTGNPRLHTQFSNAQLSSGQKIRRAMIRPFLMLGSEVILIALAVVMLILYGLLYVALSSFESIFKEIYHMSTGIAGLNYIAIFVGCSVGGQVGGRSVDIIYRRLTARNGGVRQPEFKLPVFMVGVILFPIGLILYGFSAQYHVFWLVPDIGACIFAFGNFLCMLTLQTYAVDCYSIFSASALASLWHVRGLAGFGFPMWSVYAYKSSLGYGWTNGLVALVWAILGLPTPFLFYRYGPWLRERSKYHIAAMKTVV